MKSAVPTQHQAPMGLDVVPAVEAFTPGTPRLQAIQDAQWDLLLQENAAYDAWMDTGTQKRRNLQQSRFNFQQFEKAKGGTEAGKRSLATKVARDEKAVADHETRKPQRTSGYYGFAEMIAGLGGRPVRDANFTEDADPGLGPAEMLLKRQSGLARNILHAKATDSARVPRDQAELAVVKAIKAQARNTDVRFASRMTTNEFGHARQGNIRFPETADGKVNAVGLLFDMFGPEIQAKLNARLAALYQDGTETLGNADRRDRLETLAAERLTLERQVVYWADQCQAMGIPSNYSGVTNPLAILKVEFV